MNSLYFLLPCAFLSLTLFLLDFFAFNFYKTKAKILPKNEESYKYFINKEGLWGLMNLLSIFAIFALLITGFYFSNSKSNGFYGYGTVMIIGIIVAVAMVFKLSSKRTEFLESLKKDMPYGDRKGTPFSFFIFGICFSLGNSLGLFIFIILEMMLE